MRTDRRILLAGLLAMAAAGCAGSNGSSTRAGDSAPTGDSHVIHVLMTMADGPAAGRITVNGKEVAPAELPDVLRSLTEKGGPARERDKSGPPVCEIQMPGDAPYQQVASMLLAAVRADIVHLRLTDGVDGFDYTMPAVDPAGRSPSVQVRTELTRKDGDTWVSPLGAAPMPLTQAGVPDAKGNEAIRNALKKKWGVIGQPVQMVLRPAADVPFRDVMTVYSDCARAQYKEIAFAPPPGIVAADGPAATQAGHQTAPAHVLRIVYIIDCSASVADSLAGLKREIVESAGRLLPVQRFDIVVLSEKNSLVFSEMQAATVDIKHGLAAKLRDIKAAGDIEGKLQPFQDAFEAAFAMKPQMIYFVTESSFDPKLLDVVDGLNKDHKVRVNALMLVREDEKFQQELKELAQRNGGQYKFIAASAVMDSDAGNTGNGGK